MPETSLYRNLWHCRPWAILLDIDLVSFWNIPLPDNCCCSVGGRVGEGGCEALWPALYLQALTVRVKNLAQRPRFLISVHWSYLNKGFRLKAREKELQNQFHETGSILMKGANSVYWGCNFLYSKSSDFVNTQEANTASSLNIPLKGQQLCQHRNSLSPTNTVYLLSIADRKIQPKYSVGQNC